MRNPDSAPGENRLLLVSNHLPITIGRSENGEYDFSMSSGGLMTGLSGLATAINFQWYGWPGLEVPENEIGTGWERLNDEFNTIPVFMDDKLADRNYSGFSNSILWPLLHYHPGEVVFGEAAWDAYRDANSLFAKTIATEARDGDLIWIHYYHLMLLPEMLREELRAIRNENIRTGFLPSHTFP